MAHNNGDLAVCMGHEADQFSESVVAKNAFQVLGDVLGNVPGMQRSRAWCGTPS